jgi:hypothetical protein
MDDVATSFNDMLALTLVGVLFLWSPQKIEALTVEVPEVEASSAAIAQRAPLVVVTRGEGELEVAGERKPLAEVLALVRGSPRPIVVEAGDRSTWGEVARAISRLSATWPWVRARVARAGAGR